MGESTEIQTADETVQLDSGGKKGKKLIKKHLGIIEDEELIEFGKKDNTGKTKTAGGHLINRAGRVTRGEKIMPGHLICELALTSLLGGPQVVSPYIGDLQNDFDIRNQAGDVSGDFGLLTANLSPWERAGAISMVLNYVFDSAYTTQIIEMIRAHLQKNKNFTDLPENIQAKSIATVSLGYFLTRSLMENPYWKFGNKESGEMILSPRYNLPGIVISGKGLIVSFGFNKADQYDVYHQSLEIGFKMAKEDIKKGENNYTGKPAKNLGDLANELKSAFSE